MQSSLLGFNLRKGLMFRNLNFFIIPKRNYCMAGYSFINITVIYLRALKRKPFSAFMVTLVCWISFVWKE